MIQQLVKDRYGIPLTDPSSNTDNSILQTLLEHVSCRRFKTKQIGEPLMELLFAAAFSAPSKSDLQQVSVIRVGDKEKRRLISGFGEELRWTEHAPEFMVWCGDSRRIRRICEWKGLVFNNDHLDAFMNAAVDTGIVMQNFITAAESVGLGCCPVSQVRDYIEPLSAALALPEYVFPVAGLCVGWPEHRSVKSMRLPLSVTVHQDHYDDSQLLKQVDAYDKRRERIDQTPEEKQRLSNRYGISNSYGWSENHARQYSVSMRADFGSYIRKQKFDLS